MEKKRPGISNLQGLTQAILRRRRRPSGASDYVKAEQSSDGEENEKKFTLLSKAGSRLVSGVKRILRRVENSRGVETIRDFLLGGYQRLSKPSSFQFFSCREPRVHGSRRNRRSFSFYSDADGSYGWTSEDDRNSQAADCTPKKDLEYSSGQKMTGSFLNFGGYHDQQPSRQPSVPSSSMAAAAKPRAETRSMAAAAKPRRETLSMADKKLAKSRAETRSMIEKKLREIVMARNISLEDVFDIEEFLRCYSRLTSPLYVDIVNQFFMDACGEFLELLNE